MKKSLFVIACVALAGIAISSCGATSGSCGMDSPPRADGDTPLIYNGTAYLAGEDGNFYAVDIVTGLEKWRYEALTDTYPHYYPASSNMVVYNSLVWFLDSDGKIFGIDPDTGDKLKGIQTEIPIFNGKITIAGGVIYYSVSGNFYAIDIETEQPIVPAIFDYGFPVLSTGGLIYLSREGVGSITALDETTLEKRWSNVLGETLRDPIVVSSDSVFLRGDNTLFALDNSAGLEKWRFQAQSYITTPPAVSGGAAFFGASHNQSPTGYFYAVNVTDGSEKWKINRGECTHAPVTAAASGNTAYYSIWDIYAHDAETGRKKWEFKPENVASSPLVISEGTIYFRARYAEKGGYLYAVDAVTGEEKWRFKM
ncbi:MAG: PQQ-binding-like beta-propeller repeat protein [Nitrospinota bacterium]|nr:PQQ-binding-like beta-propeller repeat protein [Nitrospinota bacterium]